MAWETAVAGLEDGTGLVIDAETQILEARGFKVVLVNARHVRSVPGCKSDVSD